MKSSTLKRLYSYLKPYKKAIIFSLIFSIFAVALTLCGPILIGFAVDSLNDGSNSNKLNAIILALLATFVFGALSFKILGLVTNKVCYSVVKKMREQAFSSVVNAQSDYTDTQEHGVIISKIVSDADIVSDGLIQGVVALFVGVVTIVATLVIMFVINFYIALIVLLLTPLSLITATKITKNAYKYMLLQTKLQGEFFSNLSESVDGIKTIKAFNASSYSKEKFAKINDDLRMASINAQYELAKVNPSTRFVNSIVFAAVCVVGAIFTIKLPSFTIGTLTIFLTYANQYTKPFSEVSAVVAQMAAAVTSAERVFSVTDIESEINTSTKHIQSTQGNFEITNLSFSYNKKKPLITNLNLSVKRGEKVAIVGPTGSGKTTLINLIMRFYNIDSGQITLDNNNIYDIELTNYRQLFGMVLQDTVIFTDTVYNNILYGSQNATKEQVIQAATAAHAHFFIQKLKDGYDTVLDDSVSISAGQKQLICIARIMLAKPQILILDEATSNVDILTEQYIQQGFKEITSGKTSFIVAHRLSTITDADTIIVMDKGQIVEQGNHQTLMQNQGFYYELFTGSFS